MVDIPADTTTDAVLTVGGTFSGVYETSSDVDWIEVTLEEGSYYEFYGSALGQGFYNNDMYLELYDANGNLVVSNDDGGVGFDSLIIYFAESGGTFYIAAVNEYGLEAGSTYDISLSEVPEPVVTDALIWNGGSFAPGQTVNVYFGGAGEAYVEDGTTSFGDGFTAQQIADFTAVFGHISSFANVTFNVVSNAGSADLHIVTDNLGSDGTLGFAYPQGNGADSGLVVLNSNSAYWTTASTAPGGQQYETFVHELGHALGLAHPHDNGGGSQIMLGVGSAFDDLGDYDLNQGAYTIMTYNGGYVDHPNFSGGGDTSGAGISFMPLDIAALQEIYGVDNNHNTGNDTYTISDLNGYSVIWDNGGIDTLEAGDVNGAVINLNAATIAYEEGGGGWVSYGLDQNAGFTIAAGVMIENAIGSFGNDELIGNDSNNHLLSGLGNNYANGGEGDDAIVLLSGAGEIVGGAGSDFLIGGIQLDNIFGGSGDDVIIASTSSFIADSDLISGGAGNDILMGGLGADVFVFNFGSGNDVIGTINPGDVTYDEATGYSTAVTGADFVPGIDEIELVGFATVNAGNVTDFITDGEEGAVFSAEGTIITFFGVDADALSADDFVFV